MYTMPLNPLIVLSNLKNIIIKSKAKEKVKERDIIDSEETLSYNNSDDNMQYTSLSSNPSNSSSMTSKYDSETAILVPCNSQTGTEQYNSSNSSYSCSDTTTIPTTTISTNSSYSNSDSSISSVSSSFHL
jgi:hypothetical protein